MKDAFNFTLVMIVLFMVFMLSRKIAQKRMGQTYHRIINELKTGQAYCENSAVVIKDLEKYSLKTLKNHRPKVMEQLIACKIVGVTADQKFFIKQDPDEFEIPG